MGQCQIEFNTQHHTVPRQQQRPELSPWPSLSPDLDPNKHTGNELERRVRGTVDAPANVRELFQALKQYWVAIPVQEI